MRDLDETDLEILQLLLSDARRPYSDIAETVGLSAPAVSDRVSRLREVGVIRRFTLDVDRSQLRDGIPILLEVTLTAGTDVSAVRTRLLEAAAVEHVFTTASADLVAVARVPDGDVAGWLQGVVGADGANADDSADHEDGTSPAADESEQARASASTGATDAALEVSARRSSVAAGDDATVGVEAVADLEVTLLADAAWSPDLGGAAFGLTCAECGNTVDSEGTAARVDGDLYQFCCSSCEARFLERYDEFQRRAD